MNLTDPQKDLLRLMVSKHESKGGGPLMFTKSVKGNRLSYSPRGSVRVAFDGGDLRRLQEERLITLIPRAKNRLGGKPTDLGIAMVRCGFCPKRMMREFEVGCPLLATSLVDQLNRSGEKRESELNRKLDVAEALLRQRRATVEKIRGKQKREAAEIGLLRMIASSRRQILKLATTMVRDGVREFGDALVDSQRTLGNRAALLREYTALFVAEARDKLNESPVFGMEPLPVWRKDAMTQKAIQTCEQVIAKRKKIEGALSSTAAAESKHGPRRRQESKTWSRVVQEWEALKSTKKVRSGDGERIPEADLRRILADLHAIKPEDVTEGQIEIAAIEFVHHYGRLRVVPAASGDAVLAATKAQQVNTCGDGAFWRDCEDQFRRNDIAENAVLGATWYSWGNYCSFHAGSSPSAPADSVDLFKSLARQAASGVGSPRGSKSWMDWLDLLRCAKDEDTGDFLYAKHYAGSQVMSESVIETGEAIPAGGLIEFVGTADGGIERRMYWDTKTAIIETLFKHSSNYCSKLASLAPHPIPNTGETVQSGAISDKPSTEGSLRPTTRPAMKGRDGDGFDRRAAVDAYIEEVFRKTGKRSITRTDIWKKAGDKTRTEFERWEAHWYEKHGKKTNRAAHRRFTRIWTDKDT